MCAGLLIGFTNAHHKNNAEERKLLTFIRLLMPDGSAFVRKLFVPPTVCWCFVLSDCFRTNQRLHGRLCLRTVCLKTLTLMRSSSEKRMWRKVRWDYHANSALYSVVHLSIWCLEHAGRPLHEISVKEWGTEERKETFWNWTFQTVAYYIITASPVQFTFVAWQQK